ncbi:hypothetical protein SteCoe_77 [Stentor coeruleus]|uniref:ZZ-type domain-containing protein n=1 Tax=Stentor coeruleus TaxID=5963 RepID=A0A1R2D4Y9_9CILI|nr:hypothetical protein SteCoe_77 [Stentor coeruleus]
MQANRPLNLKLMLGQEVRKTNKFPLTIQILRNLLRELYNKDTFQISYTDEKGALLKVCTDLDLIRIYEKSKGKRSVLLELKEKPYDRFECYRNYDKPYPLPRIEKKETTPDKVWRCDRKPSPEKKKVKKIERKAEKTEKPKEEEKVAQALKCFSIHDGTECKECSICPITGIRYKCIDCPEYNLCELCEEITDHQHAMMKLKFPIKSPCPIQNSIPIKSPCPIQNSIPTKSPCPIQNYIQKALACQKPLIESFQTKCNEIKKAFMSKAPISGCNQDCNLKEKAKKKLKVKIKQHLFKKDMAVHPGHIVKLAWELVNKGKQPWDSHTRFSLKKGDFSCEDISIKRVEPGQKVVVEVNIKAPDEEKICQGVWEIITGEKRFGKICGQFKTVNGMLSCCITNKCRQSIESKNLS